MLRYSNGGFDRHPFLYRCNFTKRHSGLRHPPGPGIHPQKKHLFPALSVQVQVVVVGFAGIGQRIVDVRDWRFERETIDRSAERPRDLNEAFHGHSAKITFTTIAQDGDDTLLRL